MESTHGTFVRASGAHNDSRPFRVTAATGPYMLHHGDVLILGKSVNATGANSCDYCAPVHHIMLAAGSHISALDPPCAGHMYQPMKLTVNYSEPQPSRPSTKISLESDIDMDLSANEASEQDREDSEQDREYSEQEVPNEVSLEPLVDGPAPILESLSGSEESEPADSDSSSPKPKSQDLHGT